MAGGSPGSANAQNGDGAESLAAGADGVEPAPAEPGGGKAASGGAEQPSSSRQVSEQQPGAGIEATPPRDPAASQAGSGRESGS